MTDWNLIIAAVSLELVVLTSAVGVAWKLSRIEVGLRSEFTKEIAAAHAKIYQVEIWARDEFVRKGSFETVVSRLENSMQLLGSKIESAVDKMATRIENLNHEGHR